MAKTTRTMMRIQIHMGSLSWGTSRLYCALLRSYNTRDGWFVTPSASPLDVMSRGAYRSEA
jgi:hypothetical protein